MNQITVELYSDVNRAEGFTPIWTFEENIYAYFSQINPISSNIYPMNIKFASDLHLEFSTFPVTSAEKEIMPDKSTTLLLAGDIVVARCLPLKYTDKPSKTVRWRFDRLLEAVSGFKNVYMIMGNHEHYGHGDILESYNRIKEHIAKYPNIHILENERVSLTPKVDLLACSLWTNMGNHNHSTMMICQQSMNDYNQIWIGDRQLRAADTVAIFENSFAWLKQELLDTSKDYFVMTHHLPSFQGIDPKFKGDPINNAYASELGDFIIQNPHIKNWIHGHTHFNVDYMIGETRIQGHMRGYPAELWSRRPSNWKGFKLSREIVI